MANSLLRCAPYLIDAFLKHVASGQPLTAAAALANVAPRTIQYWLDSARKDPKSQYAVFAQRYERARNRSLAGYVSTIYKAAYEGERPDWRAAAWLAERLHRNEMWLQNPANGAGSVVNVNILNTPAMQLPERQELVREVQVDVEPIEGSQNVPKASGKSS